MAASNLSQLTIVLVEPAGARNVGMIARVMKNFGLRKLVLVKPHCDPHSEEAQHMAVHAGDVLAAATIAPSLPEALTGCQRAIATTARPRSLSTPLENPREALPWLINEPATQIASALIFGPEDRGLSNDELNYAQRFVGIPSDDAYPSLNLAQAVGVCCYELYQWAIAQQPTPDFSPGTEWVNTPNTAPLDQLEGFYQQLEAVLLKIGYLYPHTATSRMQKFRRLTGRAQPSTEELAMLRGILRQVAWASQTQSAIATPDLESINSDEIMD
ncbi:MAG TPA: RNA methyltransferase [Leptolyngbyaceae cyanobacterium M33_DOE_097]|uniref:tRNA (cytidine/uridine-2'-O-)-methyltransferase TrmJ n=1 Tax=Oscillatoriales cyanobacterium SpSt-418 TaxID=2282169 RepID=A0A7C3KIP6_9CYAN|nr:RNA methyltransferase [Leptolyngbyaceae cyanobacterium M33_DOE_097]